jgi:hypothetical protein
VASGNAGTSKSPRPSSVKMNIGDGAVAAKVVLPIPAAPYTIIRGGFGEFLLIDLRSIAIRFSKFRFRLFWQRLTLHNTVGLNGIYTYLNNFFHLKYNVTHAPITIAVIAIQPIMIGGASSENFIMETTLLYKTISTLPLHL